MASDQQRTQCPLIKVSFARKDKFIKLDRQTGRAIESAHISESKIFETLNPFLVRLPTGGFSHNKMNGGWGREQERDRNSVSPLENTVNPSSTPKQVAQEEHSVTYSPVAHFD